MTTETFETASYHFETIRRTEIFIYQITPYATPDRKRMFRNDVEKYFEDAFFTLSPSQVQSIIEELKRNIEAHKKAIEAL